MGGHIVDRDGDKGNVFTVPSNEYAEFNMFLDPLAAKIVIESGLSITLVPLGTQRKATSFSKMLQSLKSGERTPESLFAYRLLSLLHKLQQKHRLYRHTVSHHHSLILLFLLVLKAYILTVCSSCNLNFSGHISG